MSTREPQPGDYIRGTGYVVDVREIQPPPPPPIRLHLIRDVNATPHLVVNGHRVKAGGTFNEFYGQGTAVKAAKEEALAMKRAYGPSARIVVEAVVTFSWQETQPGTNYYTPEFPRMGDTSISWNLRPQTPEPESCIVWDSADEDGSP